MYKVLSAIVLAFLISGCTPDAISNAKDELALKYIDRGLSPVFCDNKKIDDNNYIFCHPSRNKEIGGLYLIELYNDNKDYIIYSINGKAMQYTPSVEVAPKTYKFDIPSILEQFRM